uniref:PH domain-containing protein n=1 Tax=Strigamia maritima TaxID=126957 RepID=T1JG47_STRMM
MTENIESGSGNDATATDIRVLVREIYRNGWLKVPISPEKKSGALSKASKLFHTVWVVFCIHDDTEPFLEYYDSQQNVLGHKSTHSWHLGRCLHISPNISLQDDEHMFSVTLENQLLKFATSTQDEMMEWINVIRNKLTELGIIGSMTNFYSKEPESKPRLAPVRDPTSPLPPPPGYLRLPPGTTLSRDHDIIDNQDEEQNAVGTVDILEEEVTLRSEISEINTNQNARHSLQEAATDLFTQTEFNSMIVPSSAPPQGSASRDENIFNFNTLTVSTSEVEQNDLENSIYEPLHLTTSSSRNTEVHSERENEINSEETVERTDNLSLKEKQVALLNTQINHPGGIRLRIRRKDCLNSIALGSYLESVWILGWKQRAHPLLYNNFHIGDKIMSIEGHLVSTPQQVQKIIKQTYTPSVEFIVFRVPFGKAFAIKRDYDGQDLGLQRDNNTAEASILIHASARHGLSLKATTTCSLGLCNWMLTEINGRPLNLFYKGNEIHDRLNAVGKDISILVQPSDFVKILKKQLKSLRSYKDYIVQ